MKFNFFSTKKITLLFIIVSMMSCAVTPCDCSTEFGDAARWPTQVDRKKINQCMELYYKEKGKPNKPNYESDDYVAAHYHFTNHPCHYK